MNANTKRYVIFFGIILVITTTIIKFAEVWGGNFPFTMDQGRDMVDLRNMYVTWMPRLVGPTTSINGVLLGPFWYYFNLIPFVLSGGSPNIIVLWQIIWYQLAVIFLWWTLKNRNFIQASLIATVLLLTPTSFNSARYFWNANSMPIFTIIFFAFLYNTLFNETKKNFFWLGFVSGLGMQIEAAFGILFFPFALIYFLIKRVKPKKIINLCFGFGLTLLPQIAFEIKHKFIMTKVLLGEFSGKGSQMLGETFEFSERLVQRWEHFHDLLLKSNHLPPNYLIIIYALSLIIFALFLFSKQNDKSSNQKEVWVAPFFFTVFAGLFYLQFSQSLKSWYTLGLSVPIAIYFGSLVNYLWERKSFIPKLIAIYLVFLTIFYGLKSQIDYTTVVASKPSDDRSNLKNELAAIDWVYQNAKGKNFKLYSYLPSVYDFPYNYLIWWYGAPKYGYQPADTSYLPNQPEYIPNLSKVWTKKLPNDNLVVYTFLIIENDAELPQREMAWEGNFSKLCSVKEYTFPWKTIVKQLTDCSSGN